MDIAEAVSYRGGFFVSYLLIVLLDAMRLAKV